MNVRDAISQANSAAIAAGKAKNLDAIVALYTEDAVIVPPGAEALFGRAAVREYFAGSYAGPGELLEQENGTTSLDLLGDDLALELQWFRGRYSGPDGVSSFRGKGLILWRHEPDGAWRMHRDFWRVDGGDPER